MDPKLKKVLDLLGLGADVDEAALAKAIADLQTASTALATIAKSVGLAETANAADVAKTIAAAIAAKGDRPLAAIAKAAGLAEDASAQAIETAVASAVAKAAPDPNAFVPRSEFDQLRTTLATLQGEAVEEKATAAVDLAIEAGKITPAQRDWAVSYAKQDPKGFAQYTDGAPVIVKPGSTGAGKRPGKPADAVLDADELAICKALGVSQEAFKKSRAELAAAEEEIAR